MYVFYSGQWRPFRVSAALSFVLTFLAFLGKHTAYDWRVYAATFLTFFLPVTIVLYVATAVFLWVIPPQKGTEDIHKDWWKP